MIIGIGTDIVHIPRMQRNIDRYGDQFAKRILADAEWQDYHRNANPAQFLAKRFAAKEAFSKALGTGFRNGLHLRHIWVTHDDYGRPLLMYEEKASEIMRELGITRSHVSLADEREYAVAFVTLEKD